MQGSTPYRLSHPLERSIPLVSEEMDSLAHIQPATERVLLLLKANGEHTMILHQ